MFKNLLFFFLLGVFLITPLVGLAQFSQQQSYPGVGGQNLVGGSASQSIPSLVKYLFNLVVWVCILAAVIVLIAGGVQYITATGDVSKMTGAKTRIYSSLLGLTILIGAYFVLHTMNPSLVIPKITYVPIKEGIVFFTKDGYDDFIKADDASIINDLVNANKAKFINYSAPDLTKSDAFGPLVFSSCPGKGTITGVSGSFPKISINTTDARLDFADFDAYTFAFWGKKAQGAKLVFYSQTNYQQTVQKPIPYDYRGLLDKDGNIAKNASGGNTECIITNPKIKDAIIISPTCFANAYDNFKPLLDYSFLTNATTNYLDASNYFTASGNFNDPFTGSVTITKCGEGTYLNAMADQKFRDGAIEPSPVPIKHPPLSVRITWSSAGVYLVSADKDERYFDASARDFKDPSINFDQKATNIKIINDTPERKYTDENGETHTTPPEYRDFLAILHQNDNFSGKLKVYFEQRMYVNANATLIKSDKMPSKVLIPAYSGCGHTINDTLFNKPTAKDASLFTFDEKKLLDPSGGNVTPSRVIFKKENENYYFWRNYNFGHLPMLLFNEITGKVETNPDGTKKTSLFEPIQPAANADYLNNYKVTEETRYGEVRDKEASSVEFFELSQNPGGSGECQEVQLCTEKSGKGYCLTYTAENNKTNEASIVYYPMPWYLAVPLPYSKAMDDNCSDDLLPTFTGSDGTTKKTQEFANNIKSIIIKPEGKCAVVIMGGMANPTWWKTLANPFNFIVKSKNSENRNEVFTSSDYNLEDNEIGQCGTTFGFGRWLAQSCAVGIAVYPIK